MSISNRCKDCKHWARNEVPGEFMFEDYPGGENHKRCRNPKVGDGCYDDEKRKGSDALNAYESISTGPDFGCIHWENIL